MAGAWGSTRASAFALRLMALAAGAGLAGCAAVPLTTFAVAGTAVQSGVAIWKSGRLDTAKWAPISAVSAAAEKAMSDLSLEFVSRDYQGDHITWKLLDNANSAIKVKFYQRTETLTELQIDLGLLGNQSTARLILERIDAHLTPPHAFVEQPGPEN